MLVLTREDQQRVVVRCPNGDEITDENPIDPSWFIRAKSAMARIRLMRGEAQLRMNQACSARRSAEHDARSRRVDRVFVDVAKLELPNEVFYKLMNRTLAMTDTLPTQKLTELTHAAE